MKLKNFAFRLTFGGSGVLNYDEASFKHFNALNFRSTDNNNNFGKKAFSLDENDKLKYKLKISSNCVRHNIFSDNYAISPMIIHTRPILIDFFASANGLLRGWMFTERENRGYKRKSPVSVTDLVQISNSKSEMEFFSKTDKKTINDKNVDKEDKLSDITIYKKETIGYTEYQGVGFVDISQLQFLSCDDQFDRLALNPDDFDLFSMILKKENRFPDFNSEPKPYVLTNSSGSLPELGILFSNKVQNDLLKNLLIRLYNLKIVRGAGTFGETIKLEIKPVVDNETFKVYSDENWIEVTGTDMINSMEYDFHDYYEEVGFDFYNEIKEKHAQIIEKIKLKRKEDNAKKLEAKKEKKNSKDNNDE